MSTRHWNIGLLPTICLLVACGSDDGGLPPLSDYPLRPVPGSPRPPRDASPPPSGDPDASDAGPESDSGASSLDASDGGSLTDAASLDTGNPSFDYADVAVEFDSPLLGQWVQGDANCSYTHTFTGSGEYVIESTTGSRVVSNYSVSPPTSPDHHWLLNFNLVYDGAVDCEGDQLSDIAVLQVYFDVNGDTLSFYRTETDEVAAFSFQRQ